MANAVLCEVRIQDDVFRIRHVIAANGKVVIRNRHVAQIGIAGFDHSNAVDAHIRATCRHGLGDMADLINGGFFHRGERNFVIVARLGVGKPHEQVAPIVDGQPFGIPVNWVTHL